MIHGQVFNTRSTTDANAPAISGVTITGGAPATTYSDMWSGKDADGYAITVITTGTLTGTFTLWQTDKRNPGLADDTDWVQDTVFSPTNPAGAAVKFTDSAGNAKALRKRLKFVAASGTGTLLAYASVQQW